MKKKEGSTVHSMCAIGGFRSKTGGLAVCPVDGSPYAVSCENRSSSSPRQARRKRISFRGVVNRRSIPNDGSLRPGRVTVGNWLLEMSSRQQRILSKDRRRKIY